MSLGSMNDCASRCGHPTQKQLESIKTALRDLSNQLSEVRQLIGGRTKEHLTVKEVAEMTGRAEYTVRRWITEGRLTATRIKQTGSRGRLLIQREELNRLIGSGMGAAIPSTSLLQLSERDRSQGQS